MIVLIAGGRGFIGRRLADNLMQTDDTVFAVSREDGVDFRDFKQTVDCFEQIRPDAIINCAAHVGSLHYVTTYAADIIHDNLQMGLNIYRAAREVSPQTRIINPLSNCSYPGDADVHLETDWWKGEVHQSVFSYGNSKRILYVLARCYKEQYNITSVNFLVPNTFGPGDSSDPNKVHALNGMIIRMINAKRNNERIFEIWGSGNPIREWAYVDDIVDILTKGLTLESDLTYPVNIAQNKGYSIKESAQMIADAVKYHGRLEFNTNYQDGAPTKILDDTRFRSLFPDYKFFDHYSGICETARYYESIL